MGSICCTDKTSVTKSADTDREVRLKMLIKYLKDPEAKNYSNEAF